MDLLRSSEISFKLVSTNLTTRLQNVQYLGVKFLVKTWAKVGMSNLSYRGNGASADPYRLFLLNPQGNKPPREMKGP